MPIFIFSFDVSLGAWTVSPFAAQPVNTVVNISAANVIADMIFFIFILSSILSLLFYNFKIFYCFLIKFQAKGFCCGHVDYV
ncbi:hypothetical protein SDC9_75833 [bioreactor metagenome]|uniref:Uncharacterized protein n=1 Tax=bioreactor metagenome TaxID=1076179 RepID=A0A644YS51_9ZZZZ